MNEQTECWDMLTDILFILQGLTKNSTMQHLSLEYCPIKDAGLESKYTPQHSKFLSPLHFSRPRKPASISDGLEIA